MLARNLLAAALLLLSGAWGSALAQRPASGARNGDDIHAQFQAAFSSGNAAAAADTFAANAVRVTPDGIAVGREAIRKQIEAAMKAGLSDLAGDILLSRPLGKMTLRVGEWHAKWRGRPLHGFFTAILTYENGGVKMLEETTNVAPQ